MHGERDILRECVRVRSLPRASALSEERAFVTGSGSTRAALPQSASSDSRSFVGLNDTPGFQFSLLPRRPAANLRRMRKRENNAIQEGRVIFGRGSEQTSVALRAVRGKREREREEENTAAKTHWRICGITIFAQCRTVVVVGANAE